MRILILNIIVIVFSQTLFSQTYEFKKWLYPWGPPLGGYNDSVLGDYDENKDVILKFGASEHTVCKIEIKARHLRFYKLRPYWIYEINVLDVYWIYKKNVLNEYWNHKLYDSTQLKKMKFLVSFKQKKSINDIFIGTFSVDINHLHFMKELKLDENITYYISQSVLITLANEDYFCRAIRKLEKKE